MAQLKNTYLYFDSNKQWLHKDQYKTVLETPFISFS